MFVRNFTVIGILAGLLTFSASEARLVFTQEAGVETDTFTIDYGDNSQDFIDLEFGTSLSAKLTFDTQNDKFLLNKDFDLEGNELLAARFENNASVPTCDVASLGRFYYDTTLNSAYVCEETAPTTYEMVDITISDTVAASKVVTVGTGGNYANIADAASYLNSVTGGIILLTPETHTVTSNIDVEDIRIIGSHPKRSIVNVSGAGVIQAKDSAFENLSITIDAGLTASNAIDVKYDASTTSSLVFDWVDVTTGGTKNLLGSTAATAPILIARFESLSATSGMANIVDSIATSGLNSTSEINFSSQGGEGALNVEDWDVEIAGATNVLTTGTIETTPADTIFVYPGMNLQGAIDSVGNGGVVTLLSGVHSISAPLNIFNDDVTITGYNDSSIIEASGFTGITAETAAIQLGSEDGTSPVKDVVLSNFKLEVNGSSIHGIVADGGTDIRVTNVTVEKTAGTSGSGGTAKIGILMMDGATEPLVRPIIKNSKIRGSAGNYFTDGIHISGEGATAGLFGNGNGVQNALVESSSVNFVGETAAAFVHVSDSSLFNNRFSNMGGSGGSAYGVYMGRIDRVSMTNNIVSGSLSPNSIAMGIESFNLGADPTTKDSFFSGNIIDGEANGGVGFGTGFQIGAASGTRVANNVFLQNSILGASNGVTTAIVYRGDVDENILSHQVFDGKSNLWDTAVSIASSAAEQNLFIAPIFENIGTIISDNGVETMFDVRQHRANVDPTVNDDASKSLTVGSQWVNETNDTVFVSVDSTAGAAIWVEVTGGGTSNTFLQDTDGDTRLELERTSDDDTIYMTSNGVDRLEVVPDGSFNLNDASGRVLSTGVDSDMIAGAETQNVAIGDIDDQDNGTKLFISTGDEDFIFENGNIGVGMTPSDTVLIDAFSDTERAVVNVKTLDSTDSTQGYSAFQTATPDSRVWLNAHGENRTISRWGETLGGWNEMIALAGSENPTAHKGFIIGTNSATPLVFGTNDATRITLESTGEFKIGASGQESASLGVEADSTHLHAVNFRDSDGENVFNISNGTVADEDYIISIGDFSEAGKSNYFQLDDDTSAFKYTIEGSTAIIYDGSTKNGVQAGYVLTATDGNGTAQWQAFDGVGSDTFILDNDNTGGDVTLQFGDTLSETLMWDSANSWFVLSDDLNVDGAIYTNDTGIKYEWIDLFGCIRGSASAGSIAGGRSAVVRFDAGNNSQVRCALAVPDDWQAGSDINFDVFWSPSDNASGGLHFDFDYGVFGPTDNIATGTFTDTDITSESVTASTQTDLYSFTVTVPAASVGSDEMVNFRLQRSPGQAADTYAADINLHLVRMSYTGKKLK